MTPENITEADLREQFDRTGLASLMTFDRAIQSGAILISLIAAIKGRRSSAARRAQFVAIQYQQTQEAA